DLRGNDASQGRRDAPPPVLREPARTTAPQAGTESEPGWAVQVTSPTDAGSAFALQKQLSNQGFNAYVRLIGNSHRVFVGPVAHEEDASRLRNQLSQQHRLDGFIVEFD